MEIAGKTEIPNSETRSRWCGGHAGLTAEYAKVPTSPGLRRHVDAVPQDLRGIALVAAVQEGGTPAFDAAEKHLRASEDAVVRGQLLGAIGSVRDPALAERARALVFEPGLLRRNELTTVGDDQSEDPSLRPAVRQWLDSNFDALQKRLAPAGAELVGIYAQGMRATSH